VWRIRDPEAINPMFSEIDVNTLIKNLAKVIRQSSEELKSFIYNLYYGLLVSLIYDICGRCLNLDQRLNADDEVDLQDELRKNRNSLKSNTWEIA
jgi:hypothetical protein